jgi:23S rRNA pseudouridine955/2504/2580 synthase
LEGSIKKAEAWQDELFRNEKKKKTFAGNTSDHVMGHVKGHMKGKSALTKVNPLLSNKGCSLVLFEIETGRTHQIRAQAASRGHPLLGDKKYGAGPLSGGFLLHAWRLYLPLPFPPMIEAPLPGNFKSMIVKLFGKESERILR